MKLTRLEGIRQMEDVQIKNELTGMMNRLERKCSQCGEPRLISEFKPEVTVCVYCELNPNGGGNHARIYQ